MTTTTISKTEQYRERLLKLYGDVKSWLANTDVEFLESEKEIKEFHAEPYTAPELRLQDSEKIIIAEFEPKGWRIIGASGRVNIIGRYSSEALVFLETGKKPQLVIREKLDNTLTSESVKALLINEITEDGWYWLDNQRLGLVRLFSMTLLKGILEMVSDYGI